MGLDAGYGIGSVKPGVCTSTTRPGSPYVGQIIYETDTTLAKVWNGSAWVDTPPGKANVASPTFTGTVTLPSDTSIGNASATEISYLDGVTSAIQTQLNTKAPTASPTFTGSSTFSGVLTATAQPSFLAYRSSNLSFTGGNVLVFNTTSYNVGSHYNTSTGLFTAPVSGNYIFSASVYQSGGAYQIWFIINGNRERTFGFTGSADNILPGSSVVYLTANSTIGITSWSNAEARTLYADGNHTFFRGALIS